MGNGSGKREAGTRSRKKKRKYVAGLAQLHFRVEDDWSKKEARQLYKDAVHPVNTDNILYVDAIQAMKELPDACIDLVIADPPFGIDFRGKESQYNRDPGLVEDGYIEIDEHYESFTNKWIRALPRIMKDTGSAYLVSGWTNLRDILVAIDEAGLHLMNHLIWKYQFGVFTKHKFVSSHYHILFVVKDEQRYFFNKYEYYPEDVWIIPRTYMAGQKKNGTKLPEALICRFLNFSSKPGDLVLDPFMGNGTTAVCAKGLFRHYIGYEINDNMVGIHDNNLSKVKIGEMYRPLNEYLPSTEDLLEKYPHLRKHIERE